MSRPATTKLLGVLGCVAAAAGAAGAAAAATSGTVSAGVSPARPNSASTLRVSAHGAFPGQPSSLTVTLQPGFKASARAVPILCGPAQEARGSCPAGSKVGGGSAAVTAQLGGFTVPDTLSLSAYLGVPVARGDIASVMIAGTDSYLHASAHATGRLFKTRGGLELRFSQLPHFPTQGATITLNSLSLTAHATRTVGRGKRRHRYSLITNPPRCRSGRWNGTVSVSFQSSAVAQSVSIACRAG